MLAYYMTCYAVLRSCTPAGHMYCHAGYVANTSASGVGLGWGGCDNVMYAGVTYNLPSKGKIKEIALWKYLWRGLWRRFNEGHVFKSLGKLCKDKRHGK